MVAFIEKAREGLSPWIASQERMQFERLIHNRHTTEPELKQAEVLSFELLSKSEEKESQAIFLESLWHKMVAITLAGEADWSSEDMHVENVPIVRELIEDCIEFRSIFPDPNQIASLRDPIRGNVQRTLEGVERAKAVYSRILAEMQSVPRRRGGRIVKTPGTCGGDARIEGTRIPVWGLEAARREGIPDERILEMYSSLTKDDLSAAWSYIENNNVEIDAIILTLPQD